MGFRRQAIAAATLPFLLGVSVFYAGKAEAQLELEISADFYWELGFRDHNDDFQNLQNEDDLDSFLRFDVGGTTDNGLRYGSRLTLDDANTVITPDQSGFLLDDIPIDRVPGIADPSFAFFNDVNSGFGDFADVQFGSVFGFNAGTQADFDFALQTGQDITLVGIDWVVSDNDGDTFAPGEIVKTALEWTPMLTNTVSGTVAFEFADVVPPGPQSLTPSPADTETLVYEIRLDRIEVSEVPLPPAAWLFLGALGSFFGLRRFRAKAA